MCVWLRIRPSAIKFDTGGLGLHPSDRANRGLVIVHAYPTCFAIALMWMSKVIFDLTAEYEAARTRRIQYTYIQGGATAIIILSY